MYKLLSLVTPCLILAGLAAVPLALSQTGGPPAGVADIAAMAPAAGQPAAEPAGKKPAGDPSIPPLETSVTQMIQALVQKNMFRPGRELPPETGPANIAGPVEPRFRRLTRPFRLAAIDDMDGIPRAHLFFDNVRRSVAEGEEIEFLRIQRIQVQPPYLVCLYGSQEVRIDIGETSDDALLRLMGFSDLYEFVGTQLLANDSYATVKIDGRYHRVTLGEKLGNATIVRIESGRMWLRFEDGFEFDIEPGAKKTTP